MGLSYHRWLDLAAVDYLGQLARTGKFEAKKRGQHWYTSKEAIQQYFREANARPRGRPRHKPSPDMVVIKHMWYTYFTKGENTWSQIRIASL
jgi:hypothetical protein